MKIYIAGSSNEMERAKKCAELAEQAGWTVTEKWWEAIEAVGAANPTSATRAQKRAWSEGNLKAIDAADCIWVLAPSESRAGLHGCSVEFGYSLATHSKLRAVSGDTSSIFCGMASVEAKDDGECLRVLTAAWDMMRPGTRAGRGA